MENYIFKNNGSTYLSFLKFKPVSLLIPLILFWGCTDLFSYNEKISIFNYLKKPEKEIKIITAALILSKEIYPSIKFNDYIRTIDDISKKADSYANGSSNPRIRISAINKALFYDFGFSYDKNDYMGLLQQNHFLSSVLKRKKGVCTSMPLVYLVIAEKLNYPVYAVNAPDHTFLRYHVNDHEYINIEVTSGGLEIPDLFYIDDFMIPKNTYKNGVYLKTLTKMEYIGDLLHKNAVTYMRNGDYETAIKYLELSVELNKQNSHNHRTLAYCYKTICNSLSTAAERKPYYFKAMSEDSTADSLGTAPPVPENYWEISDKENEKKYAGLTKEKAYAKRLSDLKEKYNEYFD